MSRTQSMSDPEARALAAFDADLQRLLDVEPSCEFAARVRIRIAADRHRSDWRLAQLALSLAAAAALIVALTLRSGPSLRESRPPAAASGHDIHLANPPATNRSDLPHRTAAAVPRTSRARVDAPPAASEPEVIIDPSFAAAVRRLTIGSTRSTSDPVALEVSELVSPEPEALAVAEPLRVPELVLKPADQAGVR